MKRLVLVLLSLVLVVSIADARRKKEYAGVVKEDIYQDSKLPLQIKIGENWKASIGDENAPIRLVLIQKKFGIPNDYRDAVDYTYIPKVAIWADTSTLSAQAMLDSLVSPNYKSKQKKEMLMDFDILSQSDVTPRGKRMFTLAGETAVNWDGEAKYAKDIAVASSNAGIHVNRKYHGTIIGVKHEGVVYFFHIMCEDEFRDGVMAEVKSMLDSVVFKKTNG
jgi:hypothetical protein